MLTWKIKTVSIKELKDYEHNPRTINKKEFAKLVNSIKEDGYHQRIITNTDLTIIGGHQRKKALLAAGMKEKDQIEILVPDRTLTQDELDRINIRDNLPYGVYDFDILSSRFDPDQLITFGIPSDWLEGFMGIDETKEEEQAQAQITCDCACSVCGCECHKKKTKGGRQNVKQKRN
jgi:site-specific DNA-methyltransferase (adenine-specific)